MGKSNFPLRGIFRLFLVVLPVLSSCRSDIIDGNLTVFPGLKNCVNSEFHSELRATSSPHITHRAFDTLSGPSGSQLKASFGYGQEPERVGPSGMEVSIFINNCGSTAELLGKTRTKANGRAELSLSPQDVSRLGSGNYTIYFGLKEEGIYVSSTLRIREAATPLVIIDVDGTLTLSDAELFRNLFERLIGGEYIPKEREGAVDFVNQLVKSEYEVAYLTGRPDFLLPTTQEWLRAKKFPAANLTLAPRAEDVIPRIQGVGNYKFKELTSLRDAGFRLIAAYGNAKTDIFAYEKAGIPKEQTYILGRYGGESNTIDLGDDFAAAPIPRP